MAITAFRVYDLYAWNRPYAAGPDVRTYGPRLNQLAPESRMYNDLGLVLLSV
jgi:hypothetical protein